MLDRRVLFTALTVLSFLCAVAPAGAQPAEGAARELFRKSSSRFGPRPAAASSAQAPPVRVAAAKKTPPKPTANTTPPKPKKSSKPAVEPTVQAARESAASTSSTPSGGATARLASTESKAASTSREPLGLRYSIVKQVGKQTQEVDSDTIFRSGDRIKLQVQASDHSYLYLVLKGSSGRWKVLFPTPEIAGGNNQIPPKTTYMVPSNEKAWFSFDDQVGSEQLFILLSRKPQADLERMIYDLRKGSGPATAPAEKAPSDEPKDDTRVMLASNEREVDDVVIAGIRQKAYSRDLVFEKVEEDDLEPEWTKAVYVVDKDGSPDSRIVADIKLDHR